MTKIPVILDTDIGTDIDDTWALVMMLRSPELDVKLITTATGNTNYRAKLVAKLLETAGRTDIPVGIGPATEGLDQTLEAWVADYDLDRYPGQIYRDGIEALIRTIMTSPEPVTVIAIGPVPNLAEVFRREPRICEKSRLVAMLGSVRKGYENNPQIVAEYNVKVSVPACQAVFRSPWDITITPVDTCGGVYLKDEKFQTIRDSGDPLLETLMDNYRLWKASPMGRALSFDCRRESSCLYDTVAIYLAFSQDLLTMERLGIRVDDEGYTRIDEQAHKVNCATVWKDLVAFEDFLVDRLTGKR